MDKDSPIAALLLKMKKKPDGDAYDSGREAMRVQVKRLFKAMKTDDVDKGVDALCELIDLHEPKPVEDEDE